jgi:hypothetical protein
MIRSILKIKLSGSEKTDSKPRDLKYGILSSAFSRINKSLLATEWFEIKLSA